MKSLSKIKLVLVVIFCNYFAQINAQVFTKLTTGPVVNEANNSYFASWGDYDNDGDLDLFHSMWFGAPNNTNANSIMYQNNCNGNFTKISQIPGGLVTDGYAGTSSNWVDYDNDGDQDLFSGSNFLYQNQGNGAFVKVFNSISNFNYDYAGFNATWVDFNNDGRLDMYRGNDTIYRNDGGNKFIALHIPAFDSIPKNYNTNANSWADYDKDGFMDVYICGNTANYTNYLYHNNGDGTFTAVTNNTELTLGFRSYGCAWADVDNDGNIDLWVNAPFEGDRFFKNIGNGTFIRQDLTTMGLISGFGQAGASFADYDNDGDLDFMIPTFSQNLLFNNDGTGSFTQNLSEIVGTDTPVESYSAAWADYDNDGDLDLFVATAFGNPNDNLYINNVYENNIANTAWLKFKLNGITSNKNGVGARIYAKATINGISKWQFREVNINTTRGGESGGASGQIIHLGFGDATVIDSLKIVWASSNTTQVFTNVSVNQQLKITEGANTLSNQVPIADCVADLPIKNPAIVSGKLYKDVNNNCIFDAGDEPITNKAVQASPGNYYGFSNNNGDYTIKLPAGEYKISINEQNDNWQNSPCQTITTYTTQTVLNQTISNVNFSLVEKIFVPCSGSIGLSLNSIAFSQGTCQFGQKYQTPCPGFKHRYCSTITNNTQGILHAPNYLTMSFPPGINLDPTTTNALGLNSVFTTLMPQTQLNIGTYTINLNIQIGAQYTVCTIVDVVSATAPVVSTVDFNNVLTGSSNLVQNSSFELGNTGFTTSYTFNNCLPSVLEGVYCIGNDPSVVINPGWGGIPHSGNNFLFAGGVPNRNIWCQTIPVHPQTIYSVGAFVNNILTTAFVGFPDPSLSIFVNGLNVATSGNVPQPPTNWTEMSGSWCSGGVTNANVCIQNTKPSGGGNDFGLDDIYVRQQITAPITLTENVLCSCDPNDKAVSPIGCGENGNIKKDEILTYKIRFQNTGNGPANNILLRDELDADLDINSLRVIAASHTITDFQIIPNNVLVVKFDSIFLPSINVDEAASQGFILIQIKPKENLIDGTQIQNQVGIYFDDNEVVLTNSVLNTLWDNPYPQASFEYKHNCSNTGLAYDFINTGTSSNASYLWEFEDAQTTTSTLQNPSNIVFNSPGYKIVKLKVNLNGCIEVYADSIFVESILSDNGKKVTICHNGNTQQISINALQTQLNKGACLGACNTDVAYKMANKQNESVSITESNPDFNVIIALNPANDELMVNFETPDENKTYNVELYNYAGALVLKLINVEKHTKIETTSLQTGIYLLRINCNNGVSKTKKLFIQHQ